MYHIAICDDDNIFAAHLAKKVEEFFHNTETSVSIHIFSEGCQLLSYNGQIELYLLDIRMPELSGTELAEKIRAGCGKDDSSIIFVSSMHDAVFDSFKYHPLRFIRKELLDDELGEALLAFLRNVSSRHKDFELQVQENRTQIMIRISDLYYVESYGHYLDFHCVNRILHIRGKIGDYESILNEHYFAKANRGCLINLRYVSSLTAKSVILKNGQDFPLTRTCRSSFQSAYMKWERENKHVLTI